ncbi:MAG TPA: FKBP-type peptidyl-prolyl cis-trans isomerase [Chitinophagaceae bacterium]|nr:FKBP-type peptidyl-prolyl cis-trans isomerase [Chitinophagaceae bacterium]
MKYRILLICVLFSVMAAAQTTKPKPKTPAKPATKPAATSSTPVLKNALDSFSYAMGVSVGSFCGQQGISGVNTAALLKGLNDGAKPGQALLTEQQVSQVISVFVNRHATERDAKKAAVAKAEGKKFMEQNAKKPGVVTLASGLQYLVLRAGTDTTKPSINDSVTCHYHGTLIDGRIFESSVQNGRPITFAVHGVIQGWIEALQLMPVGSKWRLFIPSDLAYGDRQMGPDIAPGSTLIFDVELLAIKKAAKAEGQ